MFQLFATSFFISVQGAFGRQLYLFNWDNTYLRKAGKKEGRQEGTEPSVAQNSFSNVLFRFEQYVGLEAALNGELSQHFQLLAVCQTQEKTC